MPSNQVQDGDKKELSTSGCSNIEHPPLGYVLIIGAYAPGTAQRVPNKYGRGNGPLACCSGPEQKTMRVKSAASAGDVKPYDVVEPRHGRA